VEHDRYLAGLLKMAIRGQGFSDLALIHHDEGEAVGQTPFFIEPRHVKVHGSIDQLGTEGHDFDPPANAMRRLEASERAFIHSQRTASVVKIVLCRRISEWLHATAREWY
jgi:hypothetical protein